MLGKGGEFYASLTIFDSVKMQISSYLAILIPRCATLTSIARILVSRNFGPHHDNAPVQKATHVNPNVEKINDLFIIRCLISSE